MHPERIIKKHVTRAGWNVIQDASDGQGGHVLVLRHRETGNEARVRAATRPRAWRHAEEELLQRLLAAA